MAAKANNQEKTTGTDPQSDTRPTMFAGLLQEMQKMNENTTAKYDPSDSESLLGEQDQVNGENERSERR